MECPSESAIVQFIEGDEASRAIIEAHVEVCDACRLALIALVRDSERGPAPEPWRVGRARLSEDDVIAGRYRLRRRLEEASLRQVFVAEDVASASLVALELWDAAGALGEEPAGTTLDRGTDLARALKFSVSDLIGVWVPPRRIGEIEIVRLLGRGNMGGVWLARDTLLERDVAVKFGHAVGAEGLVRAKVEARAIARLAHPNILKVHRAGQVDDRPMLVTELLSGSSLDKLPKPSSAQTVIALGAGLSRGLAAAHAAHVIHRDVKPANAFLCEDGTVKLLDFGLASIRLAASLDERARGDPLPADAPAPPVIAGTPLYMAPETWRGEEPGPRSDVYSLGVLMYELLTGQPPFAGRTIAALREGAMRGLPPDLGALASVAGGELAAIVSRCLSAGAVERPTAAEVCHALEALAAHAASVATDATDAPDAPAQITVNPYRGLLPFQPEHRQLFFGRDADIAAVLDAMHGDSLVLVVGASGVGKSSIVHAGVVPAVRRGALGAGPWKVATVVPGRRPLAQLARQLAHASGADEAQMAARLSDAPEALGHQISHALRPTQSRLLLIIDQLEEVWTSADSAARRAFFDAIGSLRGLGRGARTVITLRADFLDRVGDLPASRTPVAIGPMTAEGLRAVIVGPARACHVDVEPALADALVAGALGGSASAAGPLPLLEFALTRLWEQRDTSSPRLGVSDLAAVGGLEGALASHADSVLAPMTPAERAAARRLLMALVTEGRTRARCEEDALRLDSPDARAALDMLVAGRLLVASAGERGTAHEIAHEALVGGWPTLRAWLDEDAAGREAAERLTRAAAEWDRLGRASEGLLRERQLRDAESLGARPVPELAVALVQASRAAALRARRRRLALTVGLPAALLAVAGATWGTLAQRRRQTVQGIVTRARATGAQAEALAASVDALRSRAFARFDDDDLSPAEETWKNVLAREADLDRLRQQVGATLDEALALDAGDTGARALAADVALARLLAAERLHERTLLGALRARLGAYDDGVRAAWLVSPGHVRFETDPPGASILITRYRDRGDGHLAETDPVELTAGETRELAPGSYLAVARMRDRYPTRYPFVVERGEALPVRIVLPRAADLPEGYLYIPSGRFLYGSGDDESARGFLTHQPLRPIELAAFLVARTEMTWATYIEYLRAVPEAERSAHLPPPLRLGPDGSASFHFRKVVLGEGEAYCLKGHACVDWQQLPAFNLSGEDGDAVARWQAATGRLPGAHLCSDREWERAARGADDRRFPWGDAEGQPEDACSVEDYGGDVEGASPCVPGSHPPARSPFGLEDAVGNVWEWTSGKVDIGDPDMASVRSGGFADSRAYQAITNRGLISRRFRSVMYGVRLCATPP